jgi:flagellar hook-length control protein FliK
MPQRVGQVLFPLTASDFDQSLIAALGTAPPAATATLPAGMAVSPGQATSLATLPLAPDAPPPLPAGGDAAATVAPVEPSSRPMPLPAQAGTLVATPGLSPARPDGAVATAPVPPGTTVPAEPNPIPTARPEDPVPEKAAAGSTVPAQQDPSGVVQTRTLKAPVQPPVTQQDAAIAALRPASRAGSRPSQHADPNASAPVVAPIAVPTAETPVDPVPAAASGAFAARSDPEAVPPPAGSARPMVSHPRPQTTASAETAQVSPASAPAPVASAMTQPLRNTEGPHLPEPPQTAAQQQPSAVAAAIPASVPAPHAAAPTPSIAPAANPAPAEQIAAAVSVARTPTGSGQVTVHLEPAELGQVQIRIVHTSGVTAQIDIEVQHPQTLALLQHDEPQLHRALDQAGVASDNRTISLHLSNPDSGSARGNGGAGMGGDNPRNNQAQSQAQSSSALNETDPVESGTQNVAPRWFRAGVDITA